MKVSSFLYTPPKLKITNSKNPIDYFKLMKLYSKERNDCFPNLLGLLNSIDTLRSGCGLRVIKDENRNLLAGYTYRLRKNRLDEKSLFIDALARNRNKDTKPLMHRIYSDMKNMAVKKKAEELTCFSAAGDKSLRAKYEKLGFKIDNSVDIELAYVMRSPVKKFLTSQWFKNEQFKGILGVDSLLRTKK